MSNGAPLATFGLGSLAQPLVEFRPKRSKKRRLEHVCVTCGHPFTTHLPQKSTCSDHCAVTARLAYETKRWREKRDAARAAKLAEQEGSDG